VICNIGPESRLSLETQQNNVAFIITGLGGEENLFERNNSPGNAAKITTLHVNGLRTELFYIECFCTETEHAELLTGVVMAFCRNVHPRHYMFV